MIKNLNLELSSKARFDSIDGASLVEKDLPRKKFIINSLLASGLSIIAGSPKVGKSWLVLDWCVRIAKGKDVWNLHTDSGTTLYLSLEDDESRLQDRLTAITDEVPSDVHFVTDCSKLDERLEEQIQTFVDEHMDTVLIIIDTFQLIRSAKNDSSYSNDYLEVQKLKKLADELKIAILLVHHLRKQGDSDPINEISGTNGIAGCADALFVLKKSNRTQGNATLFCTGRDIEDREIELAFSKEDCTWKMTAHGVWEIAISCFHICYGNEVGRWINKSEFATAATKPKHCWRFFRCHCQVRRAIKHFYAANNCQL